MGFFGKLFGGERPAAPQEKLGTTEVEHTFFGEQTAAQETQAAAQAEQLQRAADADAAERARILLEDATDAAMPELPAEDDDVTLEEERFDRAA